MKELLVKTNNREWLNRLLLDLRGGHYLIAETPEPDGSYTIRAFPPESMGFLKFAIEHQGYADIVGEREIPEINLGM
jgi:hypothetical protein